MQTNNNSRGFTLLEILLVVGAIAILAAIVIVAINPTKQLAQTKNAQRRADVNTILNATYQYAIDHSGTVPASVSTTEKDICKTDIATADCTILDLVDLKSLTDGEVYLTAIPVDPTNTATAAAGYKMKQTVTGRINVSAPLAEQGELINVTK